MRFFLSYFSIIDDNYTVTKKIKICSSAPLFNYHINKKRISNLYENIVI